MEILKKVVILSLISLAAHAQNGIAFGKMKLGGTACSLSDIGPIDVTINHGTLQIPAISTLKKVAGDSLERGTCQFVVPVTLAPGYRLVLRDMAAWADLRLSRGTSARIDLEIFAAGSQGDRITLVESAPDRRIRKTVQLHQDGEVLVSACGESFNLRGNTSILMQGQSAVSSHATLHLIEMTAEIERCR